LLQVLFGNLFNFYLCQQKLDFKIDLVMEDKRDNIVVFNRTLKAGKRTYFFDVKETNNGEYYLSLTESKRFFNKNDGSFYFKKRNLYLYKENMIEFSRSLNDIIQFIEENQGMDSSYVHHSDLED